MRIVVLAALALSACGPREPAYVKMTMPQMVEMCRQMGAPESHHYHTECILDLMKIEGDKLHAAEVERANRAALFQQAMQEAGRSLQSGNQQTNCVAQTDAFGVTRMNCR